MSGKWNIRNIRTDTKAVYRKFQKKEKKMETIMNNPSLFHIRDQIFEDKAQLFRI